MARSRPDAREVKSKVEAILSAQVSRRALDNPTAAWVADISDSLAVKLAQVGLIPKRDQRKADTLETFPSYVACKWIGNSSQVAPKGKRKVEKKGDSHQI
ncbi:MAG: hypothetical protein HYV60_07445 [Planctomycetia bacterium]|nr:hypothetical protein [Planctomycetia bacterium]